MPQDDKPLLIFPKPRRDEYKGSGFPQEEKFSKPSLSQLDKRIQRKFVELQDAVNKRHIEVQASPIGYDIEQVIVFEVVEGVENFENVCRFVEKEFPETTFEWMGSEENDNLEPDDLFYLLKDKDKPIPGKLYLILSNQAAINQVLSLWNHFVRNRDYKFPYGLGRFRQLFGSLKDVRKWDIQDRIIENGTLNILKKQLSETSSDFVNIEAQLWYRKDKNQRIKAIQSLQSLVESSGGKLLKSCEIQEISYQSTIIRVPSTLVDSLVQDYRIELVKFDGIMYFWPTGQIVFGQEDTEIDTENKEIDDNTASLSSEPIIALLDGYPMANHKNLSGRLIIDDPEDFGSSYSAQNMKHGTGMASIIIHGDLNSPLLPIDTKLYVRPIMKENLHGDERVPDDELLVDLVHRSIRRIFEDISGSAASAPTVKIINFAICDPQQMFFFEMSPLARLLDWLSEKYQILFIVSLGNQLSNIKVPLSRLEFDNLSQSDKNKIVLQTIYADIKNRKLLSPAESINSISVGAMHNDHSQDSSLNFPTINLLGSENPSPVTSFGFGFRNGIKPEIVFMGGRQLYLIKANGPHEFEVEVSNRFSQSYGIRTSMPSRSGIVGTSHIRGTSPATALITRQAYDCLKVIRETFVEQENTLYPEEAIIPLLKAFVIHDCEWKRADALLDDAFADLLNANELKKIKLKWLGYGYPDYHRNNYCNDHKVTIIGYGSLLDNHSHVYSMPLPPSLGGVSEWRKLTVSFAWNSRTKNSSQKYRNSKLWFELDGKDQRKNNKLGVTPKDYEYHAVRRGTIQHEVFEGSQIKPILEDDNIPIKVICMPDAGSTRKNGKETPVYYGLVVTLEASSTLPIDIYQEVKERINIPVPIIQRV